MSENLTYERKFLIFEEILCRGDLEPFLGMKSRQEFEFELKNLPV